MQHCRLFDCRVNNFITTSRHGTRLYFRRRVPDDLQPLVGKQYLVKSLDTSDRREAVVRSRALAAQTDRFFATLRTMPDRRKNDGGFCGFSFGLSWEPSGAGKRAVANDVKPGEEISAAIAVATLQSHLDASPMPPSAVITVSPTKTTGKKISEVWDAYKAEKISLGQQDGVTGGWKDGEDTAKFDHWPHVNALIQFLGDRDIGSVTPDDVTAFQEMVLSDPEGGKPRNKQKRLQRAGAVFKWAKKKRIISDDLRELFQYPGKISENPWLKFEIGDLKLLFESPDYRQQLFKKPSEYWLMPLALFTGARLNELCQLTVQDIGEHDGVATISILDEGVKRLKTKASRRIIPIHSTLIGLGFLNYVKTVKSGRIFPELPESPAKKGDFAREPSRKFTNYRRQLGIGGERFNSKTGKWEGDSRKVFHSFRATLIDALRKAEVPKDRRTRLAGHDYTDTQDKNYTGGDVLTMFDFQSLKRDIEKVHFEVVFTPFSS